VGMAEGGVWGVGAIDSAVIKFEIAADRSVNDRKYP
jgi:hypothetical protein